jgi:hypothetical protein
LPDVKIAMPPLVLFIISMAVTNMTWQRKLAFSVGVITNTSC